MKVRFTNTFILIKFYFILDSYVDGFTNEAVNPVKSTELVWKQRSTRLALRPQDIIQCEKPNLYICEDTLDAISPYEPKYCNYRNVRYHEQIYRWVAGRGCLLFTPDYLYKGGANKINLNAGCFYGNLFAPCLEVVKEDGTCGCYPFDPSLDVVANAVRDALISSAHGRWEDCFYAALDCCSHGSHHIAESNADQCNVTFDGWTCWPNTLAGTTAHQVCSSFAYSSAAPSCDLYSSKVCFPNGTWEISTDYNTCSVVPRLLRRYRYYIGILGFSIASAIPSLLCFFSLKKLKTFRIVLHRNLIVGLVARDLLLIISRSEIYLDELLSSEDTVMTSHSVICRILTMTEKIAITAVYYCIMVEGIYLHRLVTVGFQNNMNIKKIYGVGAIFCTTPAIVWAIVMSQVDDHSCWLMYTANYTQWILEGPKILLLIINSFVFIDILRELFVKNKVIDDPHHRYTAKCTMFLIPLFGIQCLLTALRPNTSNCNGEQFYFYVSYSVEGLQGFIVALLYCYFNSEVHTILKEVYNETISVTRVHDPSGAYQRPALSGITEPKVTTSNYKTDELHPNSSNDNEYAVIKPKQLHVAEIISIRGTEKLADILEPVYETIDRGVQHSAYDIDKFDMDGDSGIIPNRDSKVEDYYGFTNASSVSIECQDWIRCISSPSSSVYDNSLNEYEIKYLERKFPNQTRLRPVNEDSQTVNSSSTTVIDLNDHIEDDTISSKEVEECVNMFNEIMQFIESSEKTYDSTISFGTQWTSSCLCKSDNDHECECYGITSLYSSDTNKRTTGESINSFLKQQDTASDNFYMVPKRIDEIDIMVDTNDTMNKAVTENDIDNSEGAWRCGNNSADVEINVIIENSTSKDIDCFGDNVSFIEKTNSDHLDLTSVNNDEEHETYVDNSIYSELTMKSENQTIAENTCRVDNSMYEDKSIMENYNMSRDNSVSNESASEIQDLILMEDSDIDDRISIQENIANVKNTTMDDILIIKDFNIKENINNNDTSAALDEKNNVESQGILDNNTNVKKTNNEETIIAAEDPAILEESINIENVVAVGNNIDDKNLIKNNNFDDESLIVLENNNDVINPIGVNDVNEGNLIILGNINNSDIVEHQDEENSINIVDPNTLKNTYYDDNVRVIEIEIGAEDPINIPLEKAYSAEKGDVVEKTNVITADHIENDENSVENVRSITEQEFTADSVILISIL